MIVDKSNNMQRDSMDKKEYIEKIREFNRFYTVNLGMVGKNYKESFSIVESRILYEIRTNPGCSSGYLVGLIRLDKGYISRILKKFVNAGLIYRVTSRDDARISMHYLTEEGTDVADRIIRETNVEIHELINDLTIDECGEVCRAMDVIMKYLSSEKGGEKNV